MQKKFIFNLFLMVFMNLLIKPLYIFGIDMGVQNRLGVEEFGMYSIILNCTFLFNIILDLGVTNFNTRNISQNQQLLNKHFSTLLSLKFVLSIAYFLFTLAFAFITLDNFTERHLYLLLILMFNQFLSSFILYLRSNITSMMMFRVESVMSIMDRLLMIIIIGTLLYSSYFNQGFCLEWFVYGQTVAYLITAVIGFSIVVWKSKFTKINWNSAFFYMILKKSLPFALLAVLMAVYNRIDSVVLGAILDGNDGEIEAGIYQQSFRLLDAATMFALLFTTLLLPIFSRGIKLGESLFSIIKHSFTMLYIAGFVAIVISWQWGYEIISCLYPKRINEADADFIYRVTEGASVMKYLFIGFLGIISTYIFGTLLTANNSLKQLNIIAMVGIAIYITMNIVLTPRYKAEGAAISSMVTQLFTGIIQIILAFHVFKYYISKKYIVRMSIISVTLILSAWILDKYPISIGFIPNKLSFLPPLLVITLIAIFATAILGLVDIKKVFALLKSTKSIENEEVQENL